MSDNTTWRILIEAAMEHHGETARDVEYCTLDDAGLDREFYAGYGGCKGQPFTLWTRHRVYFPATYDGEEWVTSVPRHPCPVATRHVGNE